MPGTAAAHHPDAHDPLNDAMAPPEPGRFWGQVRDIEMRSLGFPKNADGSWGRPQPYDPNVHEFEAKQIKIVLAPLDATRPFKEIEVGLNNRKNPEFRRIIQPAIFALGPKICQLRDVADEDANYFRLLLGDNPPTSGLFVFGEYIRRSWNKEGEDWTTLQFQDVFATESECQAHQDATRAQDGQAVDDQLPFPSDAPAADPQRAEYAKFLPTLWDQAKGNVDKFHELIADSPLFAELFPPESDEVRKIIHDNIPF